MDKKQSYFPIPFAGTPPQGVEKDWVRHSYGDCQAQDCHWVNIAATPSVICVSPHQLHETIHWLTKFNMLVAWAE